MNNSWLNFWLFTASCIIGYHFLWWAYRWGKREAQAVRKFSAELEALEIRTREAEQIAARLTPDRPSNEKLRLYFCDWATKQANLYSQEYARAQQIQKEIKEMTEGNT